MANLTLPRELVDAICDCMDRPSLAASSLLSHWHWRVSAQPRLLHTLLVCCDSLASFLAFLDSSFYDVTAQYATELTLLGGTRDEDHLKQLQHVMVADLNGILSKLPALHTLHLQHLSVHNPTHFTPMAAHRPMNVIRLDRVTFGTPTFNAWERRQVQPDKERSFVPFINLFGSVTSK